MQYVNATDGNLAAVPVRSCEYGTTRGPACLGPASVVSGNRYRAPQMPQWAWARPVTPAGRWHRPDGPALRRPAAAVVIWRQVALARHTASPSVPAPPDDPGTPCVVKQAAKRSSAGTIGRLAPGDDPTGTVTLLADPAPALPARSPTFLYA